MTMTSNYALIVGIADYRTYDRSMDLPPGTSDIPGARNDVRSWYRTCLAMGFSPERIRVLASPPLSPDELGPDAEQATLGEATRESMLEGFAWLADKLDTAEPVSGLLTFTGHGDEGADGRPAICPADTNGSLDQAIQVATLRERTSTNVLDHLTILIDCCHAQVGASREQSIRARLRSAAAGTVEPEGTPRARVLAACRRDQESVSARFLGEPMGAFTWAMASTVGQWQSVVERGVARLDVSYSDLLARARGLLTTLDFAQQPVLSGPPGVAELAFLDPARQVHEGATERAPTARRKGHQLDAGTRQLRLYNFTHDGAKSLFAQVMVTGSESGTLATLMEGNNISARDLPLAANTEYWFLYNVGSLASASSVTIKVEGDYDYSQPITVQSDPASTAQAPAIVDWSTDGSPGADSVRFTNTDHLTSANNAAGVCFSISGSTISQVWWFRGANYSELFYKQPQGQSETLSAGSLTWTDYYLGTAPLSPWSP